MITRNKKIFLLYNMNNKYCFERLMTKITFSMLSTLSGHLTADKQEISTVRFSTMNNLKLFRMLKVLKF